MTFLVNIIGVLLILAWLGGVGWLVFAATDMFGFIQSQRTRVVCGVLSAVLFAVGIGVMVTATSADDPHPNNLCARGHQEWVETRTQPMFIGKTIVPGQTHKNKAWVCDEWSTR